MDLPSGGTTVGDQERSWPVLASRDHYRTGWVMALREDRVTRPGHDEDFARLVLEHPGAAAVLAVDDQDRVFCLRQYRHPAQRAFVEIPAGLLDQPGEDPQEVAVRELREEAGLAAQSWQHLGSTWSSPGISSEVVHLYLARRLSEVDRSDFVLEHEEAEMESFWVPFGDLVAAVLAGRVADAPVALAVLLCQAKGLVPGVGHDG